jgi:DNA-binding transcriptional ArsR family regulator
VVTYDNSVRLGALADPTRREIFERLARAPAAVGELAAELPVSRPAVSQHLKVLKDAGLVVDDAFGTRRIYRVEPEGIVALRDYFDSFWAAALASFARSAERPGRDRPAEPARPGNKKRKSPTTNKE